MAPIRNLPNAAGGILSYFTRHGTVANLLLMVLLLAGLFAIPNLRAQFFPDVIVDNVTVSVRWDGAGAEDVDAGVIQVLEPALLAVEGIESSASSSVEGSGSIQLDFEPNWDMARAADDVQTAVDAVTTLPDDIDDPIVRRGAWRDRVTDVVITGPVSPQQLGLFADELVARLFAEGITRTTIRGVAAPRMLVEVPSVNLMAQDVTMAEIATAIAAQVDAAPAGDVTGANARVRTGAEKRSAEEIGDIVLRTRSDGSKLVIGDVAKIIVEGSDRARSYYVGANPAVSIRVDRSATGDAIDMQGQVGDVLEELQGTLPQGVTAEMIRTRAEAISGRLNILLDNGLMGLGLVVALLFLFLNARTAFWVAAGIPVAMLAAVALMYLGGLTLNMVSLFGLIITLGIVVDDAIVVGEHADYRARTYGEPPVVAAENAAQRMAMPVFAATLTTVIAFFGLLAVGGRFGDLIKDIPLTVIAVLIASLVECFLILPHHMAHALDSAQKALTFSRVKLAIGLAVSGVVLVVLSVVAIIVGIFSWRWISLILGNIESDADFDMMTYLMSNQTLQIAYFATFGVGAAFLLANRDARARLVHMIGTHGIDAPSFVINRGFEWMRHVIFRPLMAAVIWARYVVLAGVLVVLASQVILFIRGDVNWRFFNAPERASVTGNFAMTDGASREDSLAMMREMQRATEALGAEYQERYGRNPIDYVLAEIGGNAGRWLSGSDTKDRDLLGGISIELIDADLRPYSSFAFVGELQDRVARHPLAETVSFRGWRSGPGGDALDVQFFGSSAEVLKAASQDLQTALGEFPEVSAVEDNIAYDKEELILELTAQGQALGLTVSDLARVLRNRLAGIEAATFPVGARSAEIRVELPKDELSADFLDRTQLRTPSGAYVPLADVVSVTSRTGFSTVKRENGLRLIAVTGDISEDDPTRAVVIQERLETEILPRIAQERQVDWRLAGLSEQEDQFLTDAGRGFILCLAGIYLVLAWVFASWTRPFVVMAIIPFGLVGTIYGHAAWNVPISMFSVVGLIGMTGIIINDSIVLVTTIDQYREDRGLFPSIIDGACDRLRPVMLTTLTTVLGLVPLLYETSQQAQFLKPTVITLVYGLGFGMVLVLLVVPALVAMQHDVGHLLRSMRKALCTKRAWGLRILVQGAGALALVWGAATVGFVLVTGALPTAVTDTLPLDNIDVTPIMAVGMFVAGTAVLCVLAYILGAIAVVASRLARPA
ncbi:MAG: efflux RND transporter permease subunit [Aliishimia sp.]